MKKKLYNYVKTHTRVFKDYRYRPGVKLSCPLEKFLILWKIHWKVRNELSRNERSIIYGSHYTKHIGQRVIVWQYRRMAYWSRPLSSPAVPLLFLTHRNGPSGIKHFSPLHNTQPHGIFNPLEFFFSADSFSSFI